MFPLLTTAGFPRTLRTAPSVRRVSVRSVDRRVVIHSLTFLLLLLLGLCHPAAGRWEPRGLPLVHYPVPIPFSEGGVRLGEPSEASYGLPPTHFPTTSTGAGVTRQFLSSVALVRSPGSACRYDGVVHGQPYDLVQVCVARRVGARGPVSSVRVLCVNERRERHRSLIFCARHAPAPFPALLSDLTIPGGAFGLVAPLLRRGPRRNDGRSSVGCETPNAIAAFT